MGPRLFAKLDARGVVPMQRSNAGHTMACSLHNICLIVYKPTPTPLIPNGARATDKRGRHRSVSPVGGPFPSLTQRIPSSVHVSV